MIKKLEELCPFADRCAVEYGQSDVCWEEGNYTSCVIYKELIKYDSKYLKKPK